MTPLGTSPLQKVASKSEDREGPLQPPSSVVLLVVAFAVTLVVTAQISIALGLLDPDVMFEADNAKTVLIINAVLAVVTVLTAVAVPKRWRFLALFPGALLALMMFVGSVTVGGHAWDFLVALLTLFAAQLVGRRVIELFGVQSLRSIFIVELVVGFGLLGMVVFVLGVVGAIAWWNVGLIVILLGLKGLYEGFTGLYKRRREVYSALTYSKVSVVCAGLLLLQLGWAIVWLSAPDIMYDALYYKAYLPELWANTGEINTLPLHPALNVSGLSQILAVPGHSLGSDDVGREIQFLTLIIIAITLWQRGGIRSRLGPFVALSVGTVPHLIWQSSTAYDDIVLAAGAVALTVSVMESIRRTRETSESLNGSANLSYLGFKVAFTVGLIAGACIWLKLHYVVLVVALLGGWVLAAGPLRELWKRSLGAGLGAFVIAGPSLIMRWIDTGNPVFPSYNAVFKSSFYPVVNDHFNFPFWPAAGGWEALKSPYTAVFEPVLMHQASPPGSFGLLVAAVVIAVLIGFCKPRDSASVVVWLAVIVASIAWWIQFRNLRYLLPCALTSVVLITAQLQGLKLKRLGSSFLVVSALVMSVFYLPTTVASFWNVPERKVPFAAAFGRWDKEHYLHTVYPEKVTLEAFERIAPDGARAFSHTYQHAFLINTDISLWWESVTLMTLYGPQPKNGYQALKRLRKQGIQWAIMSEPAPYKGKYQWEDDLLKRYGEVVFSANGWKLYRLAEH